ncbi:capsular polysaccharide export protein, LipB/KpsS family [Piscinibacter sakaiensis]|uniref:Capsule polysaccharide export protein n=1 Tax=Piscinibacter sakaiensis TaxID=1547922 RepID=A0A0K8P7T1_PISS1|nr:beta-3-deoxy-D-manno-oct-2-ulosonic acid transferase [Piscinibacter sakaiensis]GAP38677.1 capsule polysaccharide export protein [Piscinibacter sakaiensis]
MTTAGPSTAAPAVAPVRRVHTWGFSWRKHRLAAGFLADCRVSRLRDPAGVEPRDAVALWGSAAPPPGLPPGVALWRLEDGFLRSVGLGADLVRPLSWVVDRLGIYYDAGAPSDLERLLAQEPIDAALRRRAAALREALVAAGLTKYNLGGAAPWRRPAACAPGRPVVLVPGQVESDASIRHGAGAVHGNLALLRAVRADRPQAWIVYKPHPDVVAGLRSGRIDGAEERAVYDELVTDAPMAALLEAVDEVQVMTSLAGFEALLRGRPVSTHGAPFYAGWGLTRDLGLPPAVAARRGRMRSLDELVACALLLYPRYVDAAGRPSSAEAVLALLQQARQRGARLPAWRRALRPLLGWAARRRGG